MFLVYSGPTSKTGKDLAERLNISCGLDTPNSLQDLLIRWGSTEPIEHRPKKVLNSRKGILLATDKVKSCSVLKASGVSTPEITLAELALELKGRIKFPVLGRQRHHSQGQDIILCMQARDIRLAVNQGSEYFIEYIQTSREYRVHVFNGKIIRTSQKLLSNEEKYVPYIRNVDNGYVFGTPKIPLTAQQEQSCVQAVTALGLDFGAADVIISDDGRLYVLEVNSGPALCDAGLEVYTQTLKEFISSLA